MQHSLQQLRLNQRVVDLIRYEVRFDGKTNSLTRLEAKLLGYLAAHADRVIPKEELLSEVWGYHSRVRSRAISNTANRLRPKIEDDPSNPQHLIVLCGRGMTLRGVEILDAMVPEEPVQRMAAVPRTVRADDLLGRSADLNALRRLLLHNRLVTLAGFGGIGKTRIAEQVAANLDGHFVRLRTARTVVDLAFEIARVLNIPLGEGEPVASMEGILRGLGDALVVLDNVEQLDNAALLAIVSWVEGAPTLRVLLTSRRVFGLPGEAVHRLRGLSLPARNLPLEELEKNGAMALFLRRARAVSPLQLDVERATTIVEIIHQLGGVPLALELVASQTALRSPKQILERLPELWTRQTTSHTQHSDLHAVVRWSWELLDTAEQLTLEALSIFVGSFTLEAAEVVVEPFLDEDAPAVEVLLLRLVDCSLLEILREGVVRLSLYPPVQQFAQQHRQQNWSEADSLQLEIHHGEFYSQLGAPEFLQGLTSAGLERCRQELIADLENIQVASDRAYARGDAPLAIRCANGCAAAWIEQGPQSALVDLIPPILELPGSDGPEGVQLRVILSQALRGLARPEDAQRWLQPGLEKATTPRERAKLLMERGEVHTLAGRLPEAVADHRMALELMSEAADVRGKARAQTMLAGVLQVQGECDEALDLLEDSFRIRRMEGDVRGQVVTLRCLAVTEWSMGNLSDAHRNLHRASTLARLMGDISRLTPTLMNLAVLLVELDQGEKSRELLLEVIALCKRLGHPLHHAVTLINLAETCMDLGELDEAWGYLEAGLTVANPEAWPRVTAFAHALAAEICLKQQRLRRARRRIRRASAICKQLNDPFVVGYVETTHAQVLALLGQKEEAEVALVAAQAQVTTALEGVVLGRALVRLGHAWMELGDFAQVQQRIAEAQHLLMQERTEQLRLRRELDELEALLTERSGAVA